MGPPLGGGLRTIVLSPPLDLRGWPTNLAHVVGVHESHAEEAEQDVELLELAAGTSGDS